MPHSNTAGVDNLGLVGMKLYCKHLKTFVEMETLEYTTNDINISWGGKSKLCYFLFVYI